LFCFVCYGKIFGHVLGIIRKLHEKQGGQTLFCGISTYDKKDIEFQKIYDLNIRKLLLLIFHNTMATTHRTLVDVKLLEVKFIEQLS